MLCRVAVPRNHPKLFKIDHHWELLGEMVICSEVRLPCSAIPSFWEVPETRMAIFKCK
jgi:hypothetical protein